MHVHTSTNRSASVFFQWKLRTFDFEFGGEIVVVVKVGAEASWPVFRVLIAFSPLPVPTIRFEGSMEGCWNDPFGIRGLSICDVALGLTLSATPPWLYGLLVRGAIKLPDPLGKFMMLISYDAEDPKATILVMAYLSWHISYGIFVMAY